MNWFRRNAAKIIVILTAIAIIFVINAVISLLWGSLKGFIFVDVSTAIILGVIIGYIFKYTSDKARKYKKLITAVTLLMTFGLSFVLHYLLTMKLLSTTVDHANDLWWYLF